MLNICAKFYTFVTICTKTCIFLFNSPHYLASTKFIKNQAAIIFVENSEQYDISKGVFTGGFWGLTLPLHKIRGVSMNISIGWLQNYFVLVYWYNGTVSIVLLKELEIMIISNSFNQQHNRYRTLAPVRH